MDPNANLKEMLKIAKSFMEEGEYKSVGDFLGDANRLAELVIDLDEWICKGGFLPGNWRKP